MKLNPMNVDDVIANQEGEIASLRRELEEARAALKSARQFVNDWGPDEPGNCAARTNDMLALIDRALNSPERQ